MQLEIGNYKSKMGKDWHNLDCINSSFVDICHNIQNLPFPIKTETYKLIYMSHILEHIPWFSTVNVLKELHRILKTHGTIEIWVPDIDKLIHAYLNDRADLDGWWKHNPEHDTTKWFAGRLFTYGPDPNWHKAIFSEKYLKKCLMEAGFKSTFDLSKPRGVSHGYINLGVGATK